MNSLKKLTAEKAQRKANETKAVWILYSESGVKAGWDFMSLNQWTENGHRTHGREVEFVYPQ